MIKIIIAIKDTVAEIFDNPHIEINTASAIRAFTASVKESPHKDDYALYHIGTFDTETGMIEGNSDPLRLYSGHDVKTDNVVNLPENLKRQSGDN